MSSLRILDATGPEGRGEVAALIAALRAGGLVAADERHDLDVPRVVADILREVREGGDAAAARLTSKLDRAEVRPDAIRVPAEAIARARREADPSFLALVRRVAENIRAYQTHVRHRDPAALLRGGRRLGLRYTPIDRVGVYVPGGRALYPSTVLMTVVPAQVAGVREIAIASPPTGGEVSDLLLALAGELGVNEVLRLGGAVAIAALAYGTATIRRVDKIVGPGNAFVAEAKRQLFGQVGIDAIAGPSEVVIVADDSARADWIAADLLAQAEHDPGASILVTPLRSLAESVATEVERQLPGLARAEVTRAALERYGAAVVTGSLDDACDLASELAPEHLQIITRDDAPMLARVRHAGAIFLGAHTPVPLGDYVAGPSHVLPTGGTARFFGALGANDFMKATSLIEYDAQALAEDAADVDAFANREGLGAHAATVRVRGAKRT
jgi:histidinol dehydrogenase